jgi:predicted NBD/HSP70 family sugar kinase
MRKNNQESIRLHNSQLVLNTIYQQDEISRVNISRTTGLARTTISEIVSGLIHEGLVVETGLSQSTGGKPAILLKIDPNARLMVGIDLAENEFRGALVNLRGEITHRVLYPVGENDGENALKTVYKLIENLLDAAQVPVIGIGIGAPGLMDPECGVIHQAVNLEWQDLALGELLTQRFGLPTQIANDCQVAAMGEYIFGDFKGDHLILIKAGRGIGAGLVLGGKLFFGDNAGAGEIGHIQVVQNGERCRCGNHGCLETILSSRSLIEHSRRSLVSHPHSILSKMVSESSEISLELLNRAYHQGDGVIHEILNEAASKLGSVTAHLVGALNINAVLIAGSLCCFGEGLLGPVRQNVQTGILNCLGRQTTVAFASLGEDIVLLGAASLVLKNELGLF